MTLTKNKKVNPLICSVEYAIPDDIESMNNVELNQVKIVLKQDKAFSKIYGSPSSFNFQQPPDTSASGLLYKQKLTLYYPGIETESEKQLEYLERVKAVYKITYQNNIVQILGSKENPARLVSSLASNEATGNAITITCDSDEKAKFIIM